MIINSQTLSSTQRKWVKVKFNIKTCKILYTYYMANYTKYIKEGMISTHTCSSPDLSLLSDQQYNRKAAKRRIVSKSQTFIFLIH